MNETLRELDHRTNDRIDVWLLWREHDNQVIVAVADDKTGDRFSIELREGERPVRRLQSPVRLCRLARRRDQGRAAAPPDRARRDRGLSTEPRQDLVAALRGGDPEAFAALVDRHSSAMIRVAMAYVPSRAAAEEAVQETWIAVMRGISGFECRSSLKTWIFRILTNVAMRSGARERRSVPFSALAEAEDTGEPSVDPGRFLAITRCPGHWAVPPARWPTPEEGLLAGETREVITAAIAELPRGAADRHLAAGHRGLELGGGSRGARDLSRATSACSCTAPAAVIDATRRGRGRLTLLRGESDID